MTINDKDKKWKQQEQQWAQKWADTQAMLFKRNYEEISRLRRALDNIKVRAYELNQKELHDMALEALQDGSGD